MMLLKITHDYEVIAKVETNKIEPPPTGTYKRDENDLFMPHMRIHMI